MGTGQLLQISTISNRNWRFVTAVVWTNQELDVREVLIRIFYGVQICGCLSSHVHTFAVILNLFSAIKLPWTVGEPFPYEGRFAEFILIWTTAPFKTSWIHHPCLTPHHHILILSNLFVYFVYKYSNRPIFLYPLSISAEMWNNL